MPDVPLARVVDELVSKMREPLGLDRWQVRVVFGPGEDTAACNAMPEYRICTLSVDPDKLDTGDELDEIIAHELAHAHTWGLASVAEDFAVAVAEMSGNPIPLARCFKEQIRKAEEDCTTMVGHAYIRLLRRIWEADGELAKLRAELRALKRKADAAA